MTEPEVASSDATNMEATCVVDGDEIVINGRKWWSTGVGNTDCKILVFMGVTDPDADRHRRHSMVLVPMDTPGVKVERLLTRWACTTSRSGTARSRSPTSGCRWATSSPVPGEGFAIAQGRLGPGASTTACG